jgi:hypothetical protein
MLFSRDIGTLRDVHYGYVLLNDVKHAWNFGEETLCKGLLKVNITVGGVESGYN